MLALEPLLRRPLTWIVLAAGAVAAVVALALFQPWKLWVDETVDEALPGVAAEGTAAPSAPAPAPAPAPSQDQEQDQPATGPVTLAGGTLISHEHPTRGSVRVVRLPDGSRVLRLEGLNTSNGPDLKVWLTDAPVLRGRSGWHVFDDGRYVNLGRLKGNKGSQNYPLPADLRLDRYSSVSIWCDRFNVSFGAAPLRAA